MLRHFAPDHEVFRGGPLRRAPNQTTAPTATLQKQSSYACNKRQTSSRLGLERNAE